MNNLRQITENSISYLKSFYPQAENVEVDEMELSKDKKQCFMTLSYEVSPSTPSELLSVKKETRYKVFQVELKTGDILTMKNREEY
jgi:hypothetical protein